MEPAFSVLAGAELRWGQVRTSLSTQVKVLLDMLAHNLSFFHVSGGWPGCRPLSAMNSLLGHSRCKEDVKISKYPLFRVRLLLVEPGI